MGSGKAGLISCPSSLRPELLPGFAGRPLRIASTGAEKGAVAVAEPSIRQKGLLRAAERRASVKAIQLSNKHSNTKQPNAQGSENKILIKVDQRPLKAERRVRAPYALPTLSPLKEATAKRKDPPGVSREAEIKRA